MNRMKYFRSLLIISIGIVLFSNQLLFSQTDLSRKEKKAIEKYFEDKARAAGYVLKGGELGNPIPSIDPSYCSTIANVDIVPPSWHPSATTIEWTITTFVGAAVEHPDWGEYIGSGPGTVFRFHPTSVTDGHFGVQIYFEYVQKNNLGFIVQTSFDHTIVYKTPAVFNFGSDIEVCQGETATLTLSGSEVGMEYQLFNSTNTPVGFPFNGTGSSIQYTVNVADTYTVEGQNSSDNTCASVMTGAPVVTVNPIPAVTLVSDQAANTFCEGTSVTFTAGGAIEYEFYKGSITPANIVKARSTDDFYTASNLINGDVINVVGWDATSTQCSDNASVTLVVNDKPTSIISGSTSICNGGCAIKIGNIPGSSAG